MESFTISGSYTDYYEITMGQAYFMSGDKDTPACFDYFFRKMPFNGGYVIFAGLQDVLDILSDFRFTEKTSGSWKTRDSAMTSLNTWKSFVSEVIFTPSVKVMSFSLRRPVIRVEGNIIETQIVETMILNILNYQSLVATKAARMRQVAGDSILSEFGLRRAQGYGSLQASRAAVIGGFDSTSNVLGALSITSQPQVPWHIPTSRAMMMNLPPSAIMPALIQKIRILLVDTYDTLRSGIPNAIKIAHELEKEAP